MYNLGDKGCGTRDTSQHFLGLFCSLGVDNEQYFELLKADEQVVWFFFRMKTIGRKGSQPPPDLQFF